MALTPNIGPGGNFGGFTEGAKLRKPPDRGAIQQGHADVDVFGDDSPLVDAIEARIPGFRKDLLRQREQESQADMLRSRSQHPEADGFSETPNPYGAPNRVAGEDQNDSPFQTNRDLFTNGAVGQVRGEREIKEAGMSPANVTPGAKAIGKGGVIRDEDMHTENAGSKLNAPGSGMVNNRVAGFQRWYRFYGH